MQALRDGVIASTYLQAVGEPPASFPNESELRATYEANKEVLLQPRSWRLAQIYIADPVSGANKAPSAAASAKLDLIKKALAQSNAEFAAIAKEQSEESSSAALGERLAGCSRTRGFTPTSAPSSPL